MIGLFTTCRKPMGNVPTSPPSMPMPMSVGCREVSLTTCPCILDHRRFHLSLVIPVQQQTIIWITVEVHTFLFMQTTLGTLRPMLAASTLMSMVGQRIFLFRGSVSMQKCQRETGGLLSCHSLRRALEQGHSASCAATTG